jgi:hypothetical protein
MKTLKTRGTMIIPKRKHQNLNLNNFYQLSYSVGTLIQFSTVKYQRIFYALVLFTYKHLKTGTMNW